MFEKESTAIMKFLHSLGFCIFPGSVLIRDEFMRKYYTHYGLDEGEMF